jgi:hypothetical protein
VEVDSAPPIIKWVSPYSDYNTDGWIIITDSRENYKGMLRISLNQQFILKSPIMSVNYIKINPKN